MFYSFFASSPSYQMCTCPSSSCVPSAFWSFALLFCFLHIFLHIFAWTLLELFSFLDFFPGCDTCLPRHTVSLLLVYIKPLPLNSSSRLESASGSNNAVQTQRSIKWMLLWAKHTIQLCWKGMHALFSCVRASVYVCIYVCVHPVSIPFRHILLGLSTGQYHLSAVQRLLVT